MYIAWRAERANARCTSTHNLEWIIYKLCASVFVWYGSSSSSYGDSENNDDNGEQTNERARGIIARSCVMRLRVRTHNTTHTSAMIILQPEREL